MKNSYTFKIGNEKRTFDGNTSGTAYDKCVHWLKSNRKKFIGKPILLTKNKTDEK